MRPDQSIAIVTGAGSGIDLLVNGTLPAGLL